MTQAAKVNPPAFFFAPQTHPTGSAAKHQKISLLQRACAQHQTYQSTREKRRGQTRSWVSQRLEQRQEGWHAFSVGQRQECWIRRSFRLVLAKVFDRVAFVLDQTNTQSLQHIQKVHVARFRLRQCALVEKEIARPGLVLRKMKIPEARVAQERASAANHSFHVTLQGAA